MNELSDKFQSEHEYKEREFLEVKIAGKDNLCIQKLVSIVEHEKRAINQAMGCSDVSKLNIID